MGTRPVPGRAAACRRGRWRHAHRRWRLRSIRARGGAGSEPPPRAGARLRRRGSVSTEVDAITGLAAIGAAGLTPVQQDYLLEARQMQSLSFAAHIPLVCFAIAFPAMVLFV